MAGYGAEGVATAFHFLNKKEIAGLLPVATSLALKKGDTLFREGDVADGVYFLANGRLAVLQETGFKDRTQVVALLDPGAPAGEGGVLEDSRRGATLIAIEESTVFYLSRESLTALAVRDPQIMIRILQRLLYAANLRLQKSSERLAHIL